MYNHPSQVFPDTAFDKTNPWVKMVKPGFCANKKAFKAAEELMPSTVCKYQSHYHNVWQVAALLMSSHRRCGANSPARTVSANAPLMSYFWHEVVLAPVSAVVLYLESVEIDEDICPTTVHIGVSRSLLGVTYLNGIDFLRPAKCVDPERVLVRSENGYSLRPLDLRCSGNEYRDLSNEEEPVVCTFAGTERSCFFVAANAMWLLNATTQATDGSGNQTVMIWEIPQSPQEKPVEPLELCIPGSDVLRRRAGVFLSKTMPDEAVVVARDRNHIVLTLFDVRKTMQSKRLAVLVSTGMLPFEDHGMSLQVVLVMRRKKTLDAVFIAQTYEGDVFELDPGTGRIRQITPHLTEKEELQYSEPHNLTQLSSSVFCIWHEKAKSYELWDCNNMDKPLRAINPDDNFDQVVAGGGFLFVVVKHSVMVIEPFARCLVAAFSLAMPAFIHPQDSLL
ncbi:hypothetical protein Pelo_15993 [Pelomyxa schiedti]|nr:hypothetical protein Pelo_15993 [Pelomyxa schiedti]